MSNCGHLDAATEDGREEGKRMEKGEGRDGVMRSDSEQRRERGREKGRVGREGWRMGGGRKGNMEGMRVKRYQRPFAACTIPSNKEEQ